MTRLLPRASALLERAADSRTRSRVVVHGDLHFGQIFLGEDGEISSVIDVDTLGVADAAEDAAAFLSHAIVSALLTLGPNQSRVWKLADLAAERTESDELVRGLALVHLIGHALAATDRGDTKGTGEIEAAADALLNGKPPSTSEAKNALTRGFDSP